MIPLNNHASYTLPDEQEMQRVHRILQTPCKVGRAMELPGYLVDSPTVFQMNGTFYMMFVAIAKDCSRSGYETHLSHSDDLIHWHYMGKVLQRQLEDRWDSRQCGGYISFVDIELEHGNTLEPIDGKYYMAYIGANQDGYEPDPLSIGMAWSHDPTTLGSFNRLPEPVLSPMDADSRQFEQRTMYKSCIFHDRELTTGYPYVNVYNAKDEQNRERIFLAVSCDGVRWERYGAGPILDQISDDKDGIITGDPQIIKLDHMYVMLYFRFRRGMGAYNTFACSYDLVHWQPWQGEPLIKPELQWENVHAHKPWLIQHGGVLYHFYCAVNDQGERFIALAKSVPEP